MGESAPLPGCTVFHTTAVAALVQALAVIGETGSGRTRHCFQSQVMKPIHHSTAVCAPVQVLVVIGETGSGKTTQMTQYLAEVSPLCQFLCTAFKCCSTVGVLLLYYWCFSPAAP